MSKDTKKNIHQTGALSMLLQSGGVKKIPFDQDVEETTEIKPVQISKTLFETAAGIKFSEHELIEVDPQECEPWRYANRPDEELGNIEELIQSIKENRQLQPALIRPHPQAKGKLKYEIIFGRRRHLACLKLGIPLLAIKKDFKSDKDAIAVQDAENKFRQDVSPYANALLYKKLLEDGVFKEYSELAQKLNVSKSSFSELMTFTKLPKELLKAIPHVDQLSVRMAVQMTSMLSASEEHYPILLALAPKIGVAITSTTSLDHAVKSALGDSSKVSKGWEKTVTTKNGQNLFTFKVTGRGTPSITINNKISSMFDYDDFCSHVKSFFDNRIG